MYRDKKITIYIPCRNESKNLELIAKRIPHFVDEVIAVSNRSSDDTVEKAKLLGMKAVEDNRTVGGIGYGYAHMTGIENATGDILISIDGDGQHPVEDIASIIDFLIDNDLDFISCNRFPPKKNAYLGFKQWFGSKVLNFEANFLYGTEFRDILSGMFVFKREVANKLNLTEGGWDLSPQIKINAATNPEINFSEFNIFQYSRMSGKTHQSHLKTGIQHMSWIFRNWVGLRANSLKKSLHFAK